MGRVAPTNTWNVSQRPLHRPKSDNDPTSDPSPRCNARVEQRSDDLTVDEHAYLRTIAATPRMSATERDRWLGVPASTGHVRRKVLEARGYVRLTRVRTGRRGGAAALVELTERAVLLLDGCQQPTQHADADAPIRAYHRRRIADWAVRQGWQPDTASDDPAAPLIIRRAERSIAVQVMLHGDEAERATLRSGRIAVDALYLVFPSAEALQRMTLTTRQFPGPEPSRKVRCISLARLLAEEISTRPAVGWCDRQPRVAVGDDKRVTSLPPPRVDDANLSGTARDSRQRGHAAALRTQLAEALRHVDDAFVLDHLPLARLPAIVPYAAPFSGRTAASGRGLQRLIQDAAARLTEIRPDGTFATFVRAYVGGASVAAAARRAGVTREHASRVFRPRLIDYLVTEVRTLLRASHGGERRMPGS